MNGDVQSNVGELCVAWSGWLDLLCWMSIKFEWKLKLKGQQSFCYEQLSFYNCFFLGVGFLTWFSKCLTLDLIWDSLEGKMHVGVGCINIEG
jgi:hypothetical protein